MPLFPRRGLLALATGFSLVLVLQAGRAAGQATADEGKPIQVKFYSVDQVEVHGKFYPGAKKTDGPCVLLVTDIGGKIDEKGWDSLARNLQKKGYPVLAFDFRGHGESTRVDKEFWGVANLVNRTGAVKRLNPAKLPESINWRDFSPAYYVNLVNDIAAAKVYLDSRPDVNSANVIVIGARSGAEIAALWINEEFHRYRLTGPAGQTDSKPEGRDLFGCVWLSMNPRVGKIILSLNARAMLSVCKDQKVPMAFLYGDKDKPSATIASGIVKSLQTKNGKGKVEIGKKAITGSDKLMGVGLLTQELETEKFILAYLDQITADKVLNPYDADKLRDFKNSTYIWKFSSMGYKIAKQAGQAALVFIPTGYFTR